MNLAIRPELARRALAQPQFDHRPAVRTGPPSFVSTFDAPLANRASLAGNPILDAFGSGLPPVAQPAAPSSGGAITKGLSFFKSIASKIAHGVGSASHTLKQTLLLTRNKLAHGLISFGKKVGGFFKSIGSKIGHAFGGAGRTLKHSLLLTANKLAHGAISFGKKFGGFFKSLSSKIAHGVGIAGKTLKQTLTHVRDRIGHGAISLGKKVGGFIKSLF